MSALVNQRAGLLAGCGKSSPRLIAAGMCVALLAACDGLLDVDLPGRLEAEKLEDPAMVTTTMVGMLSDLECAFQTAALTGSLLAEELYYVGAGGRANQIWGNRDASINEVSHSLGCGAIGGVYLPLQTARFQGETLYARVTGFPQGSVPNVEEVLATAATTAGYSTNLLGEAFCEVAFDGGPVTTRAQAFERAEEWFTTALDHGGSQEIRDLALVGRARARLNLGDGAGAVADARQVSAGFVRLISTSRSSGRRENVYYGPTREGRTMSVAAEYRGLTIGGQPDHRVVATLATGAAADGITPLWFQGKYLSYTDPMVMASWREAQLIIAEVNGGQEAVDIVNQLRASHGLPSFSSTDADEIRDTVLEERRRELFLDGHRHGDMLRLGIPFRQGLTEQGEPLGDVTCIPLPNMERVGSS